MSPLARSVLSAAATSASLLPTCAATKALGVFFRVRRRKLLHLGDPERQRLVAAGDRLEAQVLVVGELLFERVLAILECVGHDGLRHFGEVER